jgi:hypothetical protein
VDNVQKNNIFKKYTALKNVDSTYIFTRKCFKLYGICVWFSSFEEIFRKCLGVLNYLYDYSCTKRLYNSIVVTWHVTEHFVRNFCAYIYSFASNIFSFNFRKMFNKRKANYVPSCVREHTTNVTVTQWEYVNICYIECWHSYQLLPR